MGTERLRDICQETAPNNRFAEKANDELLKEGANQNQIIEKMRKQSSDDLSMFPDGNAIMDIFCFGNEQKVTKTATNQRGHGEEVDTDDDDFDDAQY